MISRWTDSTTRNLMIAAACAIALLTGALAVSGDAGAATPAKSGVIKGNPSDKRLASEFLRLLKAKDKKGLKRFLDPAFLLQRGDGSYLNKKQYLADPSKVDAYAIRGIVATKRANFRVIRFEAKTTQIVNGEPVPAGWIPRLSTFVKTKNTWTLISHANFLEPPKD